MAVLPVLLAVDEGSDALGAVAAQLVQRYGRDYGVECFTDPEEALQTLTELAGVHEERRPLSLETSMPGVLAAEDVRHASVKRVASAVGEGAIAVQRLHSLFADERLYPGQRPAAEASAARS